VAEEGEEGAVGAGAEEEAEGGDEEGGEVEVAGARGEGIRETLSSLVSTFGLSDLTSFD
jgi:hypothetical protein